MFRFADRDLGMDCDFVVTGDSLEDVKGKAMAHAKEKHGDVLGSLSAEQMAAMDKQLSAAIKKV
jgi:predicted small metal-binding protein